MGSATPLDLQRTEIELVLQSGLFAKAPRLEKFFRYICERHLEGEADQIKEYSIATEALGRMADFDPKNDSIVRVEAHRLRKRLEGYYGGEGADHLVHIQYSERAVPSALFFCQPTAHKNDLPAPARISRSSRPWTSRRLHPPPGALKWHTASDGCCLA